MYAIVDVVVIVLVEAVVVVVAVQYELLVAFCSQLIHPHVLLFVHSHKTGFNCSGPEYKIINYIINIVVNIGN